MTEDDTVPAIWTITSPVTGDDEVDTIGLCMASMNLLLTDANARARVAQYLSDRFPFIETKSTDE